MTHQLALFALAPLLIGQGLYVRAKTDVLSEPKGDRSGYRGAGPGLRLLVLGDSAAAGVGVDHQDKALLGQIARGMLDEYRVYYELIATTGHTTADSLQAITQVDDRQFDVVVTSLGVNDLTSGSSLVAFERRLLKLVTELRTRFKSNHIILSGMPPMHEFPALPQPLRWCIGRRARAFDRVIEQVSVQLQTDYLQFEFESDPGLAASDGFHPGPLVYQQWAALIVKKIKERRRSNEF